VTSVVVQNSPAPAPGRGDLSRLKLEVEPGQNTTGFSSVVVFVPYDMEYSMRPMEAEKQKQPFLESAESSEDIVCHQSPNVRPHVLNCGCLALVLALQTTKC